MIVVVVVVNREVEVNVAFCVEPLCDAAMMLESLKYCKEGIQLFFPRIAWMLHKGKSEQHPDVHQGPFAFTHGHQPAAQTFPERSAMYAAGSELQNVPGLLEHINARVPILFCSVCCNKISSHRRNCLITLNTTEIPQENKEGIRNNPNQSITSPP
jgi:hypothetical protein